MLHRFGFVTHGFKRLHWLQKEKTSPSVIVMSGPHMLTLTFGVNGPLEQLKCPSSKVLLFLKVYFCLAVLAGPISCTLTVRTPNSSDIYNMWVMTEPIHIPVSYTPAGTCTTPLRTCWVWQRFTAVRIFLHQLCTSDSALRLLNLASTWHAALRAKYKHVRLSC